MAWGMSASWGTSGETLLPGTLTGGSAEMVSAPPICAARASPDASSQWSCRAGNAMISLGRAASTNARAFVLTRVRRASVPSSNGSRWANNW